jgi:FMN-dependent NADH-azoreductase
MKTFEHNATTGEIIERDLTKQELAQTEIDAVESAAQKAAYEAKATARQAVLDRLGITAEEAQLILGGSN